MTFGDTLRDWCIALGYLAEQNNARRIVIETGTATYEDRRGEGLRVEIDAGPGRHPRTHELPEGALGDERYELVARS